MSKNYRPDSHRSSGLPELPHPGDIARRSANRRNGKNTARTSGTGRGNNRPRDAFPRVPDNEHKPLPSPDEILKRPIRPARSDSSPVTTMAPPVSPEDDVTRQFPVVDAPGRHSRSDQDEPEATKNTPIETVNETPVVVDDVVDPPVEETVTKHEDITQDETGSSDDVVDDEETLPEIDENTPVASDVVPDDQDTEDDPVLDSVNDPEDDTYTETVDVIEDDDPVLDPVDETITHDEDDSGAVDSDDADTPDIAPAEFPVIPIPEPVTVDTTTEETPDEDDLEPQDRNTDEDPTVEDIHKKPADDTHEDTVPVQEESPADDTHEDSPVEIISQDEISVIEETPAPPVETNEDTTGGAPVETNEGSTPVSRSPGPSDSETTEFPPVTPAVLAERRAQREKEAPATQVQEVREAPATQVQEVREAPATQVQEVREAPATQVREAPATQVQEAPATQEITQVTPEVVEEKKDPVPPRERATSSSIYGRKITPAGVEVEEKKKRKPGLFWTSMVVWSSLIITSGAVLSGWGYSMWLEAESEKKANIAYEEGAEDIISDPTFDSVVRMPDEDFDALVGDYQMNDLPDGYRITSRDLIGWSIPGGTEDNGRADVEICWTDLDTEGEKKSRVYIVSENAQDESPDWLIDAMSTTGESCSPDNNENE